MVDGVEAPTPTDTESQTVSMIKSFFLAMVAFPDVLQRAQEEIDRVVGPTRLPGFGDRDALPYISALVKELLRYTATASE